MTELTGPGDSTVTVREPAGWLDAVVKRQGEGTQSAQTFGRLLKDAYRSHARAYANTQQAWEHGGVGTCTCKMKT